MGLWDAELYMAIAHALAANIALPLNGKAAQARAAQNMANAAIFAARETAANEDYAPLESIPEWLQARGSSYAVGLSRYIYPNGPSLAVSNV